jgi:hypothetical protein
MTVFWYALPEQSSGRYCHVIEPLSGFRRVDAVSLDGSCRAAGFPTGRHHRMQYRGTANCPTYTTPASTAVPRASMDGSKVVPSQTSTTLFNGAIPPNGFMVLGNPNGTCFLNDNGPASGAGDVVAGGGFAGFQLTTAVFVTPPGYKPIGPVNIWCTVAGYVAARAW